MSEPGRPERTFTTGPVTRWLRRLTLIAAVVVTVWVLLGYQSLPDTIPVHFGLSGEADDWGSKETILWVSLIMLACGALVHWCSRHPDSQWFNYPKTITVDNAQSLYRAGEQMMVWINVSLLVMYADIAGTIIAGWSGLLLTLLGVAVMFGGLLVGIVKMFRA